MTAYEEHWNHETNARYDYYHEMYNFRELQAEWEMEEYEWFRQEAIDERMGMTMLWDMDDDYYDKMWLDLVVDSCPF
jgi:hypothetical protein